MKTIIVIAAVVTAVVANAAYGQLFTVTAATWHRDLAGRAPVDGVGLTYSLDQNGFGDLSGSAGVSRTHPSEFLPPYVNLDGVRLAMTIVFETGWSGPPTTFPYLLSATATFSVNAPLHQPYVRARQNTYGLGLGIRYDTLAGSLTRDSGEIIVSRMVANPDGGFDFIPADLQPGNYTLAFSGTGALEIGDTQGHLRYGYQSFNIWLVAPAPTSMSVMFVCGGLALRRPGRRENPGSNTQAARSG